MLTDYVNMEHMKNANESKLFHRTLGLHNSLTENSSVSGAPLKKLKFSTGILTFIAFPSEFLKCKVSV